MVNLSRIFERLNIMTDDDETQAIKKYRDTLEEEHKKLAVRIVKEMGGNTSIVTKIDERGNVHVTIISNNPDKNNK